MAFKLYQSVPGLCELIAIALKKAGIDHYLGIPPTVLEPSFLKEELQNHPLDRQIWGIFSKEEDVDRGLEIVKGVAPLSHAGENKSFFVFITEDLLGEIKDV